MFSDDVEVDSFTSIITQSMYHPVSISTIVDAQTHLSVEDREILFTMLNRHTVLFDGILKVYPHWLVHLDTIPNVRPHHLCAYVRYSKVAHIRGFFSSYLRFLCPQCIGSF